MKTNNTPFDYAIEKFVSQKFTRGYFENLIHRTPLIQERINVLYEALQNDYSLDNIFALNDVILQAIFESFHEELCYDISFRLWMDTKVNYDKRFEPRISRTTHSLYGYYDGSGNILIKGTDRDSVPQSTKIPVGNFKDFDLTESLEWNVSVQSYKHLIGNTENEDKDMKAIIIAVVSQLDAYRELSTPDVRYRTSPFVLYKERKCSKKTIEEGYARVMESSVNNILDFTSDDTKEFVNLEEMLEDVDLQDVFNDNGYPTYKTNQCFDKCRG